MKDEGLRLQGVQLNERRAPRDGAGASEAECCRASCTPYGLLKKRKKDK